MTSTPSLTPKSRCASGKGLGVTTSFATSAATGWQGARLLQPEDLCAEAERTSPDAYNVQPRAHGAARGVAAVPFQVLLFASRQLAIVDLAHEPASNIVDRDVGVFRCQQREAQSYGCPEILVNDPPA